MRRVFLASWQAITSLSIACQLITDRASGREEIYGFGGGNGFDIFGFESEHPDPLNELALEFLVTQFTGHDLPEGDLARRCDRQT